MSRSMIMTMAALVLGLAMGCSSCENNDTGLTDVVPDKGESTDTGMTDVAMDEGGGSDTTTGNACHQCLLNSAGLSVRFTRMFVTEPSIPEGLDEYLNNIWKPDVDAYRLNVVLRLDEVTDNGNGTLKAKVTAGAGWHDLTIEQITPVVHNNVPTEFHFVEGFTTEFNAVIDENCNFSTAGKADLWFHPGPLDHAFICSGGDDTIGLPKDTIPISNLDATGHFNDECTQVTDGTLTGCIAADATCQICSFILAPDYREWNLKLDASITPEKCMSFYCGLPCQKDTGYCGHTCGKATGNVKLKKGSSLWANFGDIVRGIGTPQTCDVSGGTNNGYGLAGEWDAVQVKMKAN